MNPLTASFKEIKASVEKSRESDPDSHVQSLLNLIDGLLTRFRNTDEECGECKIPVLELEAGHQYTLCQSCYYAIQGPNDPPAGREEVTGVEHELKRIADALEAQNNRVENQINLEERLKEAEYLRIHGE